MSNVFLKLNTHAFVLVLLPIIFIPLVLYNTTSAMVHVWMVNETFTHGFLVLPLVLWLLWQKKSQILLLKPSPEPGVFLLLILLLLLWLIAAAVDVEIVQQFCMISLILTSIWIITGRQILIYIFFPLIFLYFAVPFGQVLIQPLMQFTADFTVALIKMVGIPVYRDGLSFNLATGSWNVVEECSGVRYLIASFLLGSIYAYVNYSSTKKRVIFILLSLIVPVVGNGLRAFGIVMIGHFSGMKLAIGVDHLVYGWVFFGIIIFSLFYAGSFWRDAEDAFENSGDEKPVVINKQKNYSPFVLVTIIFGFMIVFATFSNHMENKKKKGVSLVSFEMPVNFSAWQYDAGYALSWQPVSLGEDVKISRAYVLDDDFVQLNIAYYKVQRQGAEAISTSNKITNPYGGDWKLVSANKVFESDQYFTESELKYSDKKLLIWRWYRVGKYETPNLYVAKALEAYNLIIEGRTDVSILSLATEFDETKEITRQKLETFWKASSKNMSTMFEHIQNEK